MPRPVTGDFAYDHRVRGVLPVAVLLAACEPSGLTLEVTTTNPNVRSVEVLVGMDCDGDCPRGVAPPALAPRSVDYIFVVDDTAPWYAAVEGGVAGFRLAADSATEVDLLLAIGLDAQDRPIEIAYAYNVDVPLSRGDHVRVQLEPAAPVAVSLTDPPPPDGTESLAMWREPSRKRACVLAEHWSSHPEPTRDLIVPADDPDCDEVVDVNECAPWTHLAVNTPSTIDGANCSLFGALPSGADLCVLGGTPCNEVTPTGIPACEALDTLYCAPKALCSSCPGPWQPGCAFTAFSNAAASSTTPFLSCSFGVTDAGQPCLDEVIVQGVDASALLASSSSPTTTCTDVGVHSLQAPLGPFLSSVTTEVGLFKVDALTAPCKLDVHFKGVVTPTESTSLALVDLALANNAHLAVPAIIHVSPGCDRMPTCAFSVGSNFADPMLACAKEQPLLPAACGHTAGSNCLEGGPACGAACCGAGEQCVGGQCTCGGNAACSGGDICQAAVAREDQCGTTCCGGITLCPF